MTSVTIWNHFTARGEQPWVDGEVAKLPQARFPREFLDYIFEKTEELKARLDHLHQEFSVDHLLGDD
jgi:hypothetical protein